MAEVVALGASVVAFVQLADRVIGLCKFYIETVRDAPHDLRIILVEISTLRAILDTLDFFIRHDPESVSEVVRNLGGPGGALFECSRSLSDLEKLFPADDFHRGGKEALINSQKRQKFTQTLTSLAWPLKANKARKLLDDVLRYKSTITLALSAESSRDIKDVKKCVKDVQQNLTYAQYDRFYEWLESTNPSELHNRACDLHEKDTGLWMLRSKEWNDWISKKIRFLWIHGIPGAGKTVLASFLVQNIPETWKSSKPFGSVYYYCYFGHNQDETIPLLKWVLSQLCRQANHVPKGILSMRSTGRKPSIQNLLVALEEILAFFNGAYLIIDALDESLEPRTKMLDVIKTIATEPRFQKIQLLVTSREYLDIESVLSTISLPVSINIGLVDKDIRTYVHSILRSSPRFSKWPDYLRDEVEEALAVGANGMFRWAVCQIDVLRRLQTVSKIRDALKDLPETLDETYDRIFDAIPVQERQLVQRTLCLLCGHSDLGSRDTIRTDILISMIFEDWNHESRVPKDQLCDADTLKHICGCFLTISEEFVTLAHFTIREFLYSIRLWYNPNAKIRFYALSSEIVRVNYLKATLSGAIAYTGPMRHHPSESDDLYDYLLLAGYRSMLLWRDERTKEQVPSLAFNFLNPFSRHFARLSRVMSLRMGALSVLINTLPSQPDAVVLTRLLASNFNDLANIFLEGKDISSLLHTQMDVTFITFDRRKRTDVPFKGNVFELFDQFTKLHAYAFKSNLLREF